ncbi:tRNA uridine-5-carboxymethylaminomethyl(34) synthesis GTPase MnmE [Ostreibacterium oceani]|uniref:tRNA modification GTPase MnmE n=1 Tax=Ostreibacterium oceani TaxID=2654998 RepID=A0A6N7EZS4_9GAMM|nr:tRNA uridine-5-carboxymethylaminomethyl(34) synthesis GTPase MnmE [Ostreibacterium oceani]MPV86627.1 tRNA uridine-5-carboxymethylaminomethyl(34) synthesis GTPase MnmE [Ostreibacterium oceani]
MQNETIAAIATPPGMGGVGIIRISGGQALAIGQQMTNQTLTPRLAQYSVFRNAQQDTLDRGIALYFEAPNSYTGEAVVELQGHGGIHVMQRLLQAVLALGARQARPGEFTERAFLNGKMDLVQAEAVADLIASRSQSAADAAMRSLNGEFSTVIHTLEQTIIGLRVYIEAALDFSDEEIDFLSEGNIASRLDALFEEVCLTLDKANQGKVLQEGVQIVLVGQPNVGKSSLMNRLLGQERAIVTEQAGTTRDTIEESLIIQGIPVRITDTAGLREADDLVEKAGIERTKQAVRAAALAIWLRDASHLQDKKPDELSLDGGIDFIEVHNKQDLCQQDLCQAPPIETNGVLTNDVLKISAKTGQGIDQLITAIAKRITYQHHEESIFSARERHVQALKVVKFHIQQAVQCIQSLATSELVAEELRLAQNSLCEITGEFTSDDLLGEIFGQFCIGK